MDKQRCVSERRKSEMNSRTDGRGSYLVLHSIVEGGFAGLGGKERLSPTVMAPLDPEIVFPFAATLTIL